MPKKILQSELNAIVQKVGEFSNGVSISDLVQLITPVLTRRTLQRRLDALLTNGELVKTGSGPSTRYHRDFVVKKNIRVTEAGEQYSDFDQKQSAHTQSVLELSTGVNELKAVISRPVQQRKAVTYNREFLNSYQVNKTFYLSAAIRNELSDLGQLSETKHAVGNYLKKIIERLLIDLSWNSSRLEGNTYSLLETERLLKQGQEAEGKNAKEHQMILNHKAAIELLASHDEFIGMNRYTVCNLHALLADNLLSGSNAYGLVRQVPVGIGMSVFQPLNNPRVLEECFDTILQKAGQINDAIEQAFFVMVHLPYLQAFEDVNKRTSRLAANIPLLKNNMSPLSFIDVPQEDYLKAMLCVYELNDIRYLRELFVWAYKRSCVRYVTVRQVIGEPDVFKVQYRNLMKELVALIVKNKHDQRTAIANIRNHLLKSVPKRDQSQLQALIETELQNLRLENIARYRVKPSEFIEWQKNWI